jgi:two-component system NtrC family sensor kinase
MNKFDTIRVLLLANEFNSARIVLEDVHAETGTQIIEVRSREEFLQQMSTRPPDIAVVESHGFGGLPLRVALDEAAMHSRHIPVVVLGREGDEGKDAVRCIEQGAADYIPMSQICRFSQVILRVRHEQEALLRADLLEHELQQAHRGTLENQKLMAIGRLAASITHEINNPLESVTNFLYLLRTEPGLSGQGREYLAAAEREMERVTQISKQTLNFYRETRSPVRVKPADLLEEVLSLYERKIEDQRITVLRQYRSDASVLVFPGEIRQVLSNLVTNAIEASSVGGKLILRVSNGRSWSDEGVSGIRILVADNGSGIDAETRQHLGKLFYTTKGQRGTGLGLWVTRAVVKRYGGEMQLYSSTRPGRQGTVFSIFMPLNLGPRAVASGSSASAVDRSAQLRASSGGEGHPEEGLQPQVTRSYRKKPVPRAAS